MKKRHIIVTLLLTVLLVLLCGMCSYLTGMGNMMITADTEHYDGAHPLAVL